MTEPQWGPIGRQVFDRTYSRKKADGSKETFDEVVERMVDGNLALVPSDMIEPDERELLVRHISALRLVPAGRHWWVSGVPGRQFLFNCHRAGWTDQLADHVGFTFDELMKGGGVGANYSASYMTRMHRVRRQVWVVPFIKADHQDAREVYEVRDADFSEVFLNYERVHVADSREGWVYALESLCRLAQLEGPDLCLELELSDVRPRGSVIRGFGGTASGPGPLAQMMVSVAKTLRQATGRSLTGLECMEIDHAIAMCVVAGNVRRSARMSMMHWDDPDIEEFIQLKRGGGHWTTNISVETDHRFWRECQTYNTRARRVLEMIAEGMLANGEPGIFNSSLASKGEERDVRCTNPCGEIALEEWENCNLGHVNLAYVESDEQLEECLWLMTRWLVRATFGDGCSWRQREVVDRNRRIGVGFMGFQEWLWNRHRSKYSLAYVSHGVEQHLSQMHDLVRLQADLYAARLKIPSPVKTTTVAPTGTVAKMAGVTEGMHPVFARHFVRRVRYAADDAELVTAREQGLHEEPDLNNPNTVVVSYPCRDRALDLVPDYALEQVDEISLSAMLQNQAMVQRAWADNAVSFTVNLSASNRVDARVLTNTLAYFGPHLKGTTVVVEGSYEQAPIERVSAGRYEAWLAESSASDCAGACPVR